MAARAVVGGDQRSGEEGAGLRVLGVAEAEQREPAPAAPARRAAERSRSRRRRAAPRRPGAEKPRPSGPTSSIPSPGLQLAQTVGSRTDVLEQELDAALRAHAHHRQRPAEERPLALAPAPALRRGHHVELPRLRPRELVGRRDHDVAPDDAGAPAPPRAGDRTARVIGDGSPGATRPPARHRAPPGSRGSPPGRRRAS